MNEFMKKKSLEGLNGKEIRIVKAYNDFIDKLIKGGYELTEKYKGNFESVVLICPKGHKYIVTPNNFKIGRRCSCCSRLNIIQAKEEFIVMINKEGYKLISKYEFCNRYVTLICPRGHRFDIKPQTYKQGGRCPFCNTKSYGESLVRDILEKYNVPFIREKSFEKLNGIGGHALRFDFYLPNINTVIEIQGEGHFKEFEVGVFKGNTIKHDVLKRKFCIENNIQLVEISYLVSKYGREKALNRIEKGVLKLLGTAN